MNKKGIRKQYQQIAIILLTIAIIMGISINLFIYNKWTTLSEQQEQLQERAQAMENLSNSVDQVFFRARGYYAFQIESELNLTKEGLQNVQQAITHLRKLALTNDEIQLVSDAEDFFNNYETNVLPKALGYVAKNDYEALRKMSLSGDNAAVNQLLAYTTTYKSQIQREVAELSHELVRTFNTISIIATIIALMILITIIIMILRVINHFISPIEEMTAAVENYKDSNTFNFKLPNRNDEIQTLASSFEQLITTVQSKNETVTSQNEELLMQQDELYKNQSTMENALSEARFSKLRLERYNTLNHKISFTLNKQELSEIVLSYFNDLFTIDIGIFWLPESGEHSLIGYSDELFVSFKKEQLEYIKLRLKKEPYFLLKREASFEKGIATEHVYTYDLMTGVKNNKGEIGTFMALSRIGRPFSKEDMHDIYGLINRVAQAVDRIEQYEAVNHERVLSKTILDNINEGVHFVSTEEEPDKLNRSFLNIIGRSESDLNLMRNSKYTWVDDFLKKLEQPESLLDFYNLSIAPTNNKPKETSYTIIGQTLKVMNVYSVPVIINDDKVGTIFVHRDMTKEHEVDQMKTELVSTVSHELRTPLSSILGFSELLLTREMTPVRQNKYLETIQKEAKRLTNLVNDFLDLQRMEYGKQVYNFSEVSIPALVSETIESFNLDEKHTISITDHSKGILVKADPDRIQQVLTNLLSNAIKFSPKGGNIDINIGLFDNGLRVAISDEGIGIPSSQLNNMFGKFQRFDSGYSRKIGGTGLGLAISKEIITTHEGTIWIESEEGVGTTILFELPLKDKLISDRSAMNGKKTIMIVEDDTSIAMLLADELKEHGFLINHQSDVKQAFEHIKENPPACLVIDLLLGDVLTGWDLVQLVKDNEQTAHIPIIISSALDKDDLYINKFKIEKYMTKPYPPNELTKTVYDVLDITDGRILYPNYK